MHFSMLVLVDSQDVTRETADDAVEPLLAPHREDYDEAIDELTGRWDWYQVGGRWTGALSDYDPGEDPENWETCRLCDGTGMRNDALGRQARAANPEYTCNGCSGKGWEVKWPTDFKPNEGDVVRAHLLKGGEWPNVIAGVVTPDGQWHGGLMSDFPKDRIRQLVAEHPDATAVVVDCHS
jgi:hypothetical protein